MSMSRCQRSTWSDRPLLPPAQSAPPADVCPLLPAACRACRSSWLQPPVPIPAAGFGSVQRPKPRRFELEPMGSGGLLLSSCRARGCSPPLVAWRGRSILPCGCGWLPPRAEYLRPAYTEASNGCIYAGSRGCVGSGAGSRRHSNFRRPGSASRFGERDRSPACFGERGRRSRS